MGGKHHIADDEAAIGISGAAAFFREDNDDGRCAVKRVARRLQNGGIHIGEAFYCCLILQDDELRRLTVMAACRIKAGF